MCMCIYTYICIPFKSKQITALGFCVKVANQGSVYIGRLCKTGTRGRIWDGGGGGGRIRRPRAGGFGAFSSAVTSPSSQQSSLQTKFTASGDGTGRAEPGRAGTGPAPRPAAPPRGSGSIRTGTELLLVELWLSKNNDRNCFLVIPPSKKRGGGVV